MTNQTDDYPTRLGLRGNRVAICVAVLIVVILAIASFLSNPTRDEEPATAQLVDNTDRAGLFQGERWEWRPNMKAFNLEEIAANGGTLETDDIWLLSPPFSARHPGHPDPVSLDNLVSLGEGARICIHSPDGGVRDFTVGRIYAEVYNNGLGDPSARILADPLDGGQRISLASIGVIPDWRGWQDQYSTLGPCD